MKDQDRPAVPPDLRYLRAFTTMYEVGTVRAAAERLNLSQPAVSYQLRAFEREIGVPLFDRVGRRLVANAAGRRTYQDARRAVDAFVNVSSELRGQSTSAAASLVVHTVSGFGRYVLCPVLYSESFACVRTRIAFGTAEEVSDAVENGPADVGFVYRRGFSPSLQFEPVYREELVLVGPRALPARVRFDRLSQLPFVTYEEGDYVFARWFDTVYRRQPTALRSVHHADELEEVLGFVAAGRGFSIAPLDAVKGHPEHVKVRIHRMRTRCFNTVYSVVRAGGWMSPHVRSAVDALKQL